MINLEQTLNEQQNLSELCSDTPPKLLNTCEVFAPNAYYGNDLIYKLYADLPVKYPLKAVLPHAPDFYVNSRDKVWESELVNSLPEIWCYGNRSTQIYSQALKNIKIDKKVVPSASPFLYLLKLIQPDSIIPERRGTIFFPTHSTHHIIDNTSFEILASKLDCLGEEYRPISVCIYWRDFNLGRHLPFEKRGMKIVSAGHMYDPEFLFRFYHLCSLHKYSCANDYGTAILYSIKSGCSYFHLDADDLYSNTVKKINSNVCLPDDPASYVSTEVTSLEEKINEVKTFRDLFAVPRQELISNQIEFVNELLGNQSLKTPTELRDMIIAAEIKYVATAEIAIRDNNLLPRLLRRLRGYPLYKLLRKN
ncbi:hypothetical protein BCV63_10250 [Cylindrospermopsis raciborskii CS-508]|uniref:hypothetical protein n=1 Tax=Cylindrospermopsis raciborskii TaxID=77022 RepID=UPI0008DDBDDB|nr:hypothetical protein [Cylindrospermopsis raciborskii]OHY42057.1 hypothetical protein BCV63_10250 [Cylindrospermopsis raciborskii CS-508]